MGFRQAELSFRITAVYFEHDDGSSILAKVVKRIFDTCFPDSGRPHCRNSRQNQRIVGTEIAGRIALTTQNKANVAAGV